ncbi:MAG TPA: winged helix DNA-binding domain-containing protein, partial [Prevotella sp.]
HDRLKRVYASLVRGHGMTITERMYDKFNHYLYDLLCGGNSLTKKEIGEALVSTELPVGSEYLSRFLGNAENEALICSGKLRGKEHTYMLLEERVRAEKPLSRDEALARLAHNYFRSHSPATIDDFLWWSGLSIKEVRMAMHLIDGELNKECFKERVYYVHESCGGQRRIPATHAVFLPSYDEYVISYKYRDNVLNPSFNGKAFTNNGIFFPLVVERGRVIGNWKADLGTASLRIATTYFEPLSLERMQAIEKNPMKTMERFYLG